MLRLKIFTTGGTIDKMYFDAKSKYEVGDPNIARVLSGLTLNFEYSISPLLKKDSLDLTDSDRQLIFDNVYRAVEGRIIITHGTDTMVETAKFLNRIKNKTIVLTGALEPALFKTSDAMFNIGCAVAAVQILKPGVYIAMSGQIFNYDNVIKDRENNRFTAIK